MPAPRKPVKNLKILGTYQKCRHRDRNPPKPDLVEAAPTPPEWLTEQQRVIFEKKAQELMAVNLLTNLDCEALAVYSMLYEKIHANQAKVNGAMIQQFRALGNDLGMTPLSRQRLSVKPKQDEINPFDEI